MIFVFDSNIRCLLLKVMLQSGKYDLVHELFRKMKNSGEAPKALNYKGNYVCISSHIEMDV